MRIAIVDYGSGNLRSAAKAFERAGVAHDGAVEVLVTSKADVVAGAVFLVASCASSFFLLSY